MQIKNYRVDTAMGKVRTYFGHPLTFLTQEQKDELDTIGYTGKNSKGQPIGREGYLNSLGLGTFRVEQLKFDSGDFCESFLITRATE